MMRVIMLRMILVMFMMIMMIMVMMMMMMMIMMMMMFLQVDSPAYRAFLFLLGLLPGEKKISKSFIRYWIFH